MPAGIETFADGRAAVFSARKKMWHNLGTIATEAQTAEDALRLAHLDWLVTKAPVFTPDADGNFVQIPNKFATVRNHPIVGFGALGVVGNIYTPVQNLEAFTMLDAIVDEAGAHFETAGSLHDGKRVFMSMKMPKDILVGGEDALEMYLVAVNSHDGTGAFVIYVTHIRPVCQNTVTAGLKTAQHRFSIRHTTSATQRVQQAREVLELSWAYHDEFEAEMQRLIRTKVTNDKFAELVTDLFPVKVEGTKQETLANNTYDTLMALWDAPTQDGIRGTAYGAMHTLIEYVDYFMPVRGKDKATKLATRTLDGTGDKVKARLIDAVMAL